MQPFTAASHHDVLLLLIQLAVLLATARFLGNLAQRLGQPTVVGEISAGMILGPSFLSGFFPALGDIVVPQSPVGGYLLEVVSMLGAIFLLLITGLETDLTLIKRHLKTAAGVSFGGICVTFASGFALGFYLPDEFLAKPDQRLVFSLFVATAMSISAIPVIAKVLMDMNLMRRDVGQTILAAGMSDDTNGWILLSIVAALASGEVVGGTQVAMAVAKVLLFLLVSFTLGSVLVRKTIEYVQDEFLVRDKLVSVVVVFALGFGALAQALGMEAVLGAFVVGIILTRVRRLPSEVPHLLESMTLGIFAPIFFAVAGLKVNVRALLEPRLALFAVLVIAVACVGKIVGTYLGARLIGKQNHWTALSFGAGLNARGAMEIIIATIGLSLGILTQQMFSIIVVMAIVTSLMAPSALRFTLARVQPSEEELLRLEQEERAAASPLANLHRILLPLRLRDTGPGLVQKLEASIYSLLTSSTQLSLTLMTIVKPGESEKGAAYLNQVEALFNGGSVIKRVAVATDPLGSILEEVKKDYQLLMLGATEADSQTEESLFSPAIDEVVRLSSCPTLILKGSHDFRAENLSRVLVPTNGTEYSLKAAEFAMKLCQSSGAHLEVLHVVLGDSDHRFGEPTGQLEFELGRGHALVTSLIENAEKQGIDCSGSVRIDNSISGCVIKTAERRDCGLIVLGTNVRPGGDKLYLGQEVEKVLRSKSCPVIVLNG